MAEVYRDFLPQAHFSVLKRLFMSEILPWHFNDRVVTTEQQFMFVHAFMNDGKVVNPTYFEPVQAMLGPMQAKRSFIGVNRIKANLYTNQGKAIRHPAHFDVPPDGEEAKHFFVGVYHVNACNGMTVIEGERIRSRENQLILFDNVEHYGTVQTDSPTRVVINFTLRQ